MNVIQLQYGGNRSKKIILEVRASPERNVIRVEFLPVFMSEFFDAAKPMPELGLSDKKEIK